MTLIAGFRCTDGFVIAADTEITLGDFARVQGHKLLTSDPLTPPSFCIAYAGRVSYGLAAGQRVRDAIRQLQTPSYANIRQAIVDVLADFYAQHMRHNWSEIGENDPPSVGLIIGFQATDDFGVVATDGEVVYDVEDAVFDGTGNFTASIVAERMFDGKRQTTAVTQHLVQQLFRDIKSKGISVGGNTEILSRRCLPHAEPFFRLPSFESEHAASWGLEDDLWVCVRNALARDHGQVPGGSVALVLDGWLKQLNWKIKQLSKDRHDKRNILSHIPQMNTTEFGTEIQVGNVNKDIMMPPKRRHPR